MAKYVLKRLIYSLLSIIGAVTIVFFIVRLSGDPARLMLPPEATAEQVEKLRESLGLNQSLLVQYVDYLKDILTGNLGDSLYFKQSTLQLVFERLPATLELALYAILLSTLVGTLFGVFTALKRNTWLDYTLSSVAFTLQALPVFFVGIILILFFAVKLKWLPTSGNSGSASIILPVLTLAAYPIAPISRTARSTLIDTLDDNFLLTARSQGFLEHQVVFRRGLKNAFIPILTVISLELSAMIGGAVVTESIFSWPGLGQLVVQAVNNRDFPLVQTCVIVLSTIYTLINFLTDLVYLFLDPRIKY